MSAGAGDARRLDDLAAGAARRLGAERRALVAVQLQVAVADLLGLARDLLERRVDEHPDARHAAAQLGDDRGRGGRVARARRAVPADQPDRPGAELDGELGVLEAGDAADLRRASRRHRRGARAVGPGRRARARSGRSPSVTVTLIGLPSRCSSTRQPSARLRRAEQRRDVVHRADAATVDRCSTSPPSRTMLPSRRRAPRGRRRARRRAPRGRPRLDGLDEHAARRRAAADAEERRAPRGPPLELGQHLLDRVGRAPRSRCRRCPRSRRRWRSAS